jgi:plastocyanin
MLCEEPAMATKKVEIKGMEYVPAGIEIAPGDSVTWTNGSSMRHTASGDGWRTGDINPGATSAPIAFKQAGTFSYGCDYHPDMSGAVLVKAG